MLRALLALRTHSTRTHTRHRRRPLGVEVFESRNMLSASPPTVVAVEVSSTSWSANFTDYLQSHDLGENGYAIPSGSAAQTAPLPWSNINQIHIRFSEDVWIDSTDLVISGVNHTTYDFSSFTYDLQTYEAVWTLTSFLGSDSLLLDLASDGLSPIVDLQGDRLDGEWVSNSSNFPSGNGTEGGDFEFAMKISPGDYNQSALVNYTDYSGVYGKRFTTTSSPSYTPFADVNGSGAVDTSDLNLVYANFNHAVPTAAPAGVDNDAPTAATIPIQDIWDDSTNVSVSLFPYFEDDKDSDSEMTFAIESTSDPSLFDSVSLIPSTGTLVINTAASSSGRAIITVSATDTDGFKTKQIVVVGVDYVNSPPTLSSVDVVDLGWIPEFQEVRYRISGVVTDNDLGDLDDVFVTISNLIDLRIGVTKLTAPSNVGTFEAQTSLPASYGIVDFYFADRMGLSDETSLEMF